MTSEVSSTSAVGAWGDPAETRLARATRPLVAEHATNGESGFVALREGREAFAARYLLIEAAERTLDVQYYIWHNDMAGGLLLDALLRAAERGVRVRLLLDDNNTTGLDALLAAIDSQPGIEVRLFNPFRHRRWRVIDYLTDFARLNRRMHNKSLTADNRVTVVGGRNVGDEYFDVGHDVMFVDLDVLAIGRVVDDVSRDFERYWTSGAARLASEVLPPIDASSVTKQCEAVAGWREHPDAQSYRSALATLPFVRELLAGTLPFVWAVATMISDDPAKVLGRAKESQLLFTRLKALIGTPRTALRLISPYFVPGRDGVEYLGQLAARGARIEILTNSLEATDVAAVHAGYAKRRRPLLRAGIVLFELRRDGAAPSPAKLRSMAGSMGSSGSSLHAKTFAVDDARVFVGSFNFDPRSARLNTEIGFLIDSPAMAREISRAFAERIPQRAYRLTLGDGSRLQWENWCDDERVIVTSEPGTRAWQRTIVSLLSLLPIEWLL